MGATLQPLCRCCGKPIPKYTTTVYFGRERIQSDQFSRSMTERPKSKAEAQRLVNETILSVRWHSCETRDGEERFIGHAGVWDGERFVDDFFCKGPCRDRFAVVMARAGHATVAFNEAWVARRSTDVVRSGRS